MRHDTHRWSRAGWAVAAVVLACGVLSSCDGGDASPPDPPDPPDPSAAAGAPLATEPSATVSSGVSLSFVQLRIDEGTPMAQLRVVNGSDRDLAVTGVGLDWPGFGDTVTDYDTVVVAGRTLDLRFRLPEPDCDAGTAPVVGRLRLAGAAGEADEIDGELDESGSGYVKRIWQRECNDLRVDSGVTLSWGRTWTITGRGAATEMTGAVSLTRLRDDGRIVLRGIRGSVLLETALARPLALAQGQRAVTAQLRVRVPRCDEHALTESSQTFHFLPSYRFGTEQPIQVNAVPSAAFREAGQRLIDRSCVIDDAAE